MTTDSPAPNTYFRGYQLLNVYGRMTPELRDEAVDFWLRCGALGDPREARRRTDELAYLVRSPSGELVGVNTVYVGGLGQPPRPYFFYRSFIRPADRRMGLSRTLLHTTAAFLEQTRTADGPHGVVIVAENVKLASRALSRLLDRLGFRLVGKDSRGLDVRLRSFPEGRAGD